MSAVGQIQQIPTSFHIESAPRSGGAPPVHEVEPIARLSSIHPFQYTFAVDIGRTWEGTPSTLLQECNSITARNQPLSCHQLCEKEHGKDLGEQEMLQCREKKRTNWECCDVGIFSAGPNARAITDDVLEGKVPAQIMEGLLSSYDQLFWAESRLYDQS